MQLIIVRVHFEVEANTFKNATNVQMTSANLLFTFMRKRTTGYSRFTYISYAE